MGGVESKGRIEGRREVEDENVERGKEKWMRSGGGQVVKTSDETVGEEENGGEKKNKGEYTVKVKIEYKGKCTWNGRAKSSKCITEGKGQMGIGIQWDSILAINQI